LKKWEEQGRSDLHEATKDKLDFLNKIDHYDSIKQMQEEVVQEAIQEWNELPQLN
jgi:hypothetical protein